MPRGIISVLLMPLFWDRLSQSTLNAALRNFGGARKEIVPLIVDVLQPKEKGNLTTIIDKHITNRPRYYS